MKGGGGGGVTVVAIWYEVITVKYLMSLVQMVVQMK